MRPAAVPCRVRVEIDGQSGERDVANAPASCDNSDPVNQPPMCVISSPAGNMTIEAGQSVHFAGAGNDPDGDLPLSYLWQFGGAAANSTGQNPESVIYPTAGTYTVSFTVTDSQGLSCKDPATRTITVQQAASTGALSVEKAKWNRRKRKLTVEGKASPSGGRVSIKSASTGTELGTAEVERDGEWEFERRNIRPAPCRVLVEYAGTSRELAVSRAPKNCR